MISSLLRHKVTHGTTVNEDLDRSMVEGSFVCEWAGGGWFIKAADFERVFHSVGSDLTRDLGFPREGWCYRAFIT